MPSGDDALLRQDVATGPSRRAGWPGRPPVREAPATAAPSSRPRGLSKRFGDFTAVDAVDFEIQKGEAFGFLGPNGAGKTSTMRMIACLSPDHRRDAACSRHGSGAPTGPRSGAGSGSCPRRTRSTSS